ncbi:hypothetical protein RHMOL_Rhmol07G0270400 [Rhododendron molle]|uniref:Uncharacterized protein n=1 Tax=Rhododendron molle TaxID=49168 RepID=A0ACC0N4Y7_RHOML|nr:hypothetical protein RHMOL_Rhmol07G0270400 [Rhododendron molle]
MVAHWFKRAALWKTFAFKDPFSMPKISVFSYQAMPPIVMIHQQRVVNYVHVDGAWKEDNPWSGLGFCVSSPDGSPIISSIAQPRATT